jgi:hypothetical protein
VWEWQKIKKERRDKMIDLEKGEIELAGVTVHPDTKISDFKAYDKKKVHVSKRGKGRGVIRINEFIECNGIKAQARIDLNESAGIRRVVIMPALPKGSTMTLMEASRQWLRGMAKGTYEETPDYICGKYKWGYLTAHHVETMEDGTLGGWINIAFA